MDQSPTANPHSDLDYERVLKYRRRARFLAFSSVAVMLSYVLSNILIFYRQVIVVVNNTGPGYHYYSKSVYYYYALHITLFVATTVSLIAGWFIMINLAFRYNHMATELYSNKKMADLTPNERRSIMKDIDAKRKGQS